MRLNQCNQCNTITALEEEIKDLKRKLSKTEAERDLFKAYNKESLTHMIERNKDRE